MTTLLPATESTVPGLTARLTMDIVDPTQPVGFPALNLILDPVRATLAMSLLQVLIAIASQSLRAYGGRAVATRHVLTRGLICTLAVAILVTCLRQEMEQSASTLGTVHSVGRIRIATL
jgi:hypothetical protein